jgi:hypothetical protein
MNAGPAVKAEARNRGPNSGEFHNGRDGGAAKRNAVIRWMLTAHMTDRYMKGTYLFFEGSRPVKWL